MNNSLFIYDLGIFGAQEKWLTLLSSVGLFVMKTRYDLLRTSLGVTTEKFCKCWQNWRLSDLLEIMHFGKTMRYLVCNKQLKYYWTLPVYYDERKHVWFYPKHKVKMYSLGIFLAPPCFTSHCNLQKGISQNRMIISFAAGAKTPPPRWKYCKSGKLTSQFGIW